MRNQLIHETASRTRAASGAWLSVATLIVLFMTAPARGAVPTDSFSYAPFAPAGTDIPGVAFGKNADGKDVIWVGNYCSGGCTWPLGSITELVPATGSVLVHHLAPSRSWETTGPQGLAYDDQGFLWVASYNDRRIYKVRVADFTVVGGFPSTADKPIGGLAFDGENLWVQTGSGLYIMDRTGKTLGAFANTTGGLGGLDAADGFLFLVRLDGIIEVRDLSFNLIQSYPFPPAASGNPSFHGDLGVDPVTGDAYWGRRPGTQLYKLHLLDNGGEPTSKEKMTLSGAVSPVNIVQGEAATITAFIYNVNPAYTGSAEDKKLKSGDKVRLALGCNFGITSCARSVAVTDSLSAGNFNCTRTGVDFVELEYTEADTVFTLSDSVVVQVAVTAPRLSCPGPPTACNVQLELPTDQERFNPPQDTLHKILTSCTLLVSAGPPGPPGPIGPVGPAGPPGAGSGGAVGTFEWEAGKVDIASTTSYVTVPFSAPFAEYPVVIVSTESASRDNWGPVIRNVGKTSFQLRVNIAQPVTVHYFALTPGVWNVNGYMIYALVAGGPASTKEITFHRPFPRTPAVLVTGSGNANTDPQRLGVVYGLYTLPADPTEDLDAGTRGALVGLIGGTSPALQVVAIASTGGANNSGTYTSGGSGSFKAGHKFASGF